MAIISLALPTFVLSVCLFVSMVTIAFSENLADRKFCNATIERLADRKSFEQNEVSRNGCTSLEKLIAGSSDWPQFVSDFREYISPEGYQVHMYFAFRHKSFGRNVQALLYSDRAKEAAIRFFVLSKDPDRSRLYMTLITNWRNNVIGSMLKKESDRIELVNFYDRIYQIKYGKYFAGDDVEEVLKCLMLNDPLIWKVEQVIKSNTIRDCTMVKEGF